jgi:hypothetical protein
VVQES